MNLFRHHCKPISNDSSLPSLYKYHFDEKLSYVDFTYDKILTVQPLDPNKGHEHDGASIADTHKKTGAQNQGSFLLRNCYKRCFLFVITYMRFAAFIFNAFSTKVLAMRLL